MPTRSPAPAGQQLPVPPIRPAAPSQWIAPRRPNRLTRPTCRRQAEAPVRWRSSPRHRASPNGRLRRPASTFRASPSLPTPTTLGSSCAGRNCPRDGQLICARLGPGDHHVAEVAAPIGCPAGYRQRGPCPTVGCRSRHRAGALYRRTEGTRRRGFSGGGRQFPPRHRVGRYASKRPP